MPVIESVLSPAPVLVVPHGAWLAALEWPRTGGRQGSLGNRELPDM